MTLEKELEKLLNKHSRENDSNTPDFILANYLMNCLRAYEETTKEKDLWHNNNYLHKEPQKPLYPATPSPVPGDRRG